FTFRAKAPIRTPVSKPLNVEPITIPTISGAVSGAETSAESPSKTPRTPPSSRPSTGLFMSRPPWLAVHLLLRVPRVSFNAPSRRGSSASHEYQDGTHRQVGEDEQQRGPVLARQAGGALQRPFVVRRDGLSVQEARDVGRQRPDVAIAVLGLDGQGLQGDGRERPGRSDVPRERLARLRAAGEEEMQDRPERIDVRSRVRRGGVAAGLLRRHVP